MLIFFPIYPKGDNWDRGKDKVSLHHVLSMKWGLMGMGRPKKARWYMGNWVDKTLGLPLILYPGQQYDYHSAAPALCSAIIEQASEMPIDEFARKKLFEPLQVSDYYLYVLPDGSTFTTGSMFMLPRDMAKFAYLVLNYRQWHGRQILSEKGIKFLPGPTLPMINWVTDIIAESAKGKSVSNSKEVYNILKPLFAQEDDIEKAYFIFMDAKNSTGSDKVLA